MMSKRLYIDGKDAYTDFGIFITEGGYNELLSYPPIKNIITQEWQEYDGIEADLTAPKLNTQEIALRFAINKGQRGFKALLRKLSDKAYHSFNFSILRREYKLRLVSMPNIDFAEQLGLFTLRLANDFPIFDSKYDTPFSDTVTSFDFLLDDKPFTDYGVYVLTGSLSSIIKIGETKKNLLINNTTHNGGIYDNFRVNFKSKDIVINCLMRANKMDEFWRNYDTLLNNLVRPNERAILVNSINEEFTCFYKSCKTIEFYAENKIWWQFALTFTILSDTVVGRNQILATEELKYITMNNIIIEVENYEES